MKQTINIQADTVNYAMGGDLTVKQKMYHEPLTIEERFLLKLYRQLTERKQLDIIKQLLTEE